MSSRLLVAVLVGLLAVACGEPSRGEEAAPVAEPLATDPGPTTSPPPAEPDPTGTTVAPETTVGTAQTTTAPPSANAAPDFTLDLGEGGTFVLSAETRPVFLIFWAEW